MGLCSSLIRTNFSYDICDSVIVNLCCKDYGVSHCFHVQWWCGFIVAIQTLELLILMSKLYAGVNIC